MTNGGFTASHDRYCKRVPPRSRALDIRRTKTVKPPRLRLTGCTSEAKAIWQNQLQPKMIHMLRGSSATVSFEETFAEVYKIIHLVGMRRVDDSWNLYSQVSAFFAERTAQIYSAAPDDDALVLDYYDSEWDLFSRGIRSINVVFTYFNRTHYWQVLNVHGYEAGQAVWLVALGAWKTNMFDPISPRLRAALGLGTKVADICIKFASADLTLADLPLLRVRALTT
ncbi:hypothetical protein DFH08DRAFT_824231 [Mycena albidolilacea]|uniref:Cullin N-terminal domain-containing protein n=1 Tax=Mycena albidolilacea TaxID=1033008 RepID=A0AAD6Z4Q4_9AGAR|nr:hypothetical protein DFH08DRAFT_824231 [Mycena albidolilacea]